MTGRAQGSKNTRLHRWDDEQKAYLAQIVAGRSHAEIHDLVNERFGLELTVNQVKAAIGRYGLNTGRTGCFPKGHVPANKGTKGMSSRNRTTFAMGNVPINRVEIGTERLRRDGYVWVKVQDGCKNANWKAKHVMAWESANGPVPKGHVVMIADGDPWNCTADNLLLATKAEVVRFNHMRLHRDSRDITEAGLAIARLHNQIGEAKRRGRKSR